MKYVKKNQKNNLFAAQQPAFTKIFNLKISMITH